ncbi:MAG: phosphatase PAP2 family protein [Pseudomonadota bacterium]
MRLNELDEKLFVLINKDWAPESIKKFALLISNYQTWWWVAGFVLLLSIFLKKKKWIKVLLICGLALGITDSFNSHILKKGVQRLRPCHVKEVILRAGGCGSPYGMPSNHAANGATILVVASFFLNGVALITIGLLVVLVGWSRIYLGVHFPFDVLVGWGVGSLIALLIVKTLLKFSTYLRSFRSF